MAPVRIDKWAQCQLVFQTGSVVWRINYDYSTTPVVTSAANLDALASAIRTAVNGLLAWVSTSTTFLRVECFTNYPDPAVNYAGTSSNSPPIAGTVAGDYMPGNVAINGTFRSPVRGRRTIGKNKLSFIPETAIANGTLGGAAMTAAFNLLANRLAGLNVSGINFLPVTASRKYQTLHPITTLTLDNLTDSSRARLVRP